MAESKCEVGPFRRSMLPMGANKNNLWNDWGKDRIKPLARLI